MRDRIQINQKISNSHNLTYIYMNTIHFSMARTNIPRSRTSVEALQWRYNVHHGVSNHQPRHCLLDRLFRRRSKKTSKLHDTGFCMGNSPMTGEFPAQMASNAENVSIYDVIMGTRLFGTIWTHVELLSGIHFSKIVSAIQIFPFLCQNTDHFQTVYIKYSETLL